MASVTWPVGDTHDKLHVTLQNGQAAAQNITGNTGITMKIRSSSTPAGSYTSLAGSASVTSAANGTFDFTFATGDVATAGNYKLRCEVNFASDVLTMFEADFIVSY